MDTRLLKHYETELAFLREMGAEFAAAYPKIASRLGMEGIEVVDPYVERLLEGSAFLAARVQLELDMQFPAFTSNLLEIVYPHYLAPTPSMMIAQFEPDIGNAALKEGYDIPRGTTLRSHLAEGEQTACDFTTSADMTLWPIEITEAEYIDGRGELVAAGVAKETDARAGIRLRLNRTDGEPMSELALDRLVLHLDTQSGKAWALHELLATQCVGLTGRSTDRRADWTVRLTGADAVPKGFEREEALLPTPRQSFDGYRLLQEYFSMPERFLFVELTGLQPALRQSTGTDVDIYILLRDGMRDVAPAVAPAAFALNAVPAVNLFRRRCDRVHITQMDIEHHVVPNRTAGLDFEIFAIDRVIGIQSDEEGDIPFRAFYSETDLTAAGDNHSAYYTIKRRMRQRNEKERLRGVRTSYLGSEVYLSLVDRAEAPYPGTLDQLAVEALCSNRDLPMLLAAGGADVFHLPEGGPVKSVRTPVTPTRPHATLAQGDAAWKLISHLSLNYLSIAGDGKEGGAGALRELLGIYAPLGNRVTEKQLEGVVSVSSRPIVRRMSDEVLSTAVRGLEITLGFDESFYEGTSVYVLGAVLERFFRKYTTINSFTETVLKTERRGEIARWRPAAGLGRVI
ncbi:MULTISPECIES: type VI secretion system baseplate subunit TssF [unclassified Ruegeria]|uniref:type VI secretion system baseplate subunit TssF n=1 Tax=unclassified Ruegeria TaxID=2625375 RepID=UPI001ADBA27C|nr:MULTISPECIES: type VI secretion system baseplate subunit TssF [unclassified Ruegeria]MBO9413478.1 type VI secretion system baseplate subunit TssF [Ruegeria sp. R8_1]MBO9417339.1 type VI secretion system baseplate subunit TssF [Ruegeria sp. R8_2]